MLLLVICFNLVLIYVLINFCFCLIKKNFIAPFYGWGSTASRLEPLRGGQKFLVLIYRPRKDERLSRPWSQLVVLKTEPLVWESSESSFIYYIYFIFIYYIFISCFIYYHQYQNNDYYYDSCHGFQYYLMVYLVLSYHGLVLSLSYRKMCLSLVVTVNLQKQSKAVPTRYTP